MIHAYRHRVLLGSSVLSLAAFVALGCSSTQDGTGINDKNLVGQGGSSDGAGGDAGEGGSAGFIQGTGGSSGGEICDGVDRGAEPLPVDMYIMFDKSTSMLDKVQAGSEQSRWDAVKAALKAFVAHPGAGNIRAGLQYFGLFDECNVDAYATPEVPIGLLSTTGPQIAASLDSHNPQTLTPTAPAVQGALQLMVPWAAENPGRAAVVVLVTDGYPTRCEPLSPTDIADIAKAGYESDPRVLTFVVGIGSGIANLDNIARGGGTGKAFLIESGNVEQQFLQAMLSIASTPIDCEFDIPADPEDSSKQYDKDLVSVIYTPAATGTEQEIPFVDHLGNCARNNGDGWFYDDKNNPTKIHVCPGTCEGFAAGKVSIRLGCVPKEGHIG